VPRSPQSGILADVDKPVSPSVSWRQFLCGLRCQKLFGMSQQQNSSVLLSRLCRSVALISWAHSSWSVLSCYSPQVFSKPPKDLHGRLLWSSDYSSPQRRLLSPFSLGSGMQRPEGQAPSPYFRGAFVKVEFALAWSCRYFRARGALFHADISKGTPFLLEPSNSCA
jgi:hypothetical protein